MFSAQVGIQELEAGTKCASRFGWKKFTEILMQNIYNEAFISLENILKLPRLQFLFLKERFVGKLMKMCWSWY